MSCHVYTSYTSVTVFPVNMQACLNRRPWVSNAQDASFPSISPKIPRKIKHKTVNHKSMIFVMNSIISFVHVLTHNHKESLGDCSHRYAHHNEKTKMPSLLAFLAMYGEQMKVLRFRTTKGRRIEEMACEGPPSAASLHLYSRICEVGI